MSKELVTNAIDALDQFPGWVREDQIVWFHTAGDIAQNVARMAQEAAAILPAGEVWVIGIKNGGVMFACDFSAGLIQADPTGRLDIHLDFIRAERYGENTVGETVTITEWPAEDLSGKAIFLADDIIDEGITLAAIKAECQKRYPGATIYVAAYMRRTGNQVDHAPELICEPVEFRYEQFLVGYGLNWFNKETGLNIGRTERRIGFVIGTKVPLRWATPAA